MSVARTVLLKVSDNQWLRANGTRVPFIRRAVSKFMPGETFDEMLAAAQDDRRVKASRRCSRGSAKTSRISAKPTAWPGTISKASIAFARSTSIASRRSS